MFKLQLFLVEINLFKEKKMIRILSFLTCILLTCVSYSSEDIYELKPNKAYETNKISLEFMPFHANKTKTYLDEKNKDRFIYEYDDDKRELFVVINKIKMVANNTRKFGTLNNFLVLYDPDMDHEYETYWPLNAKIGDTWKGKFFTSKCDATLKEFGDVIINNKNVKYAKIILKDLSSYEKKGYAVFAENIGLIEFKLGDFYLKLKNTN